MDRNLPLVQTTQTATVRNDGSGTLVGRGLEAIKKASINVAEQSLDLRYIKARESFNRITDDGNMHFDEEPYCFPVQELDATRIELKELADLKYGKSYFPLYMIYRGGYGISADSALSDQYLEMAFNWCFERQLTYDTEVWDDLGTIHRIKEGIPRFVRGEFRMDGDTVVPVSDDQVHYYCTSQLNKSCHDTAHIWYKQGAEEGNAISMHNLCRMYESGAHYGNSWERELGLCWQIAAAEAGNGNAQHALALKHLFGAKLRNGRLYVFEDEEVGLQWMVRAGITGNPYARSFLSDTFSDIEIQERQRSACPVNQIGVRWNLSDEDLQHFRQVSKQLSRLGEQWRKH